MIRLFKRHNIRKISSLDGMWKFKTDPEKRGLNEKWHIKFPEGAAEIYVPSCWNNELGLYDYEGIAWYAANFNAAGGNAIIRFHAVTGQADVYLDGVHLGGHYGGFTGFDFILKNLAPGNHCLTVAVDNTHDSINTIPLSRVDWFHYGGITRSVEIMELKDIWIKSHKIDYELSNDLKHAKVNFQIVLENLKEEEQSSPICIYVNDEQVCTLAVQVNGESMVDTGPIILDNIELWDINNPKLNNIRIDIGQDDVSDRIGFRRIEVYDKKILLNGSEIRLKGVNRHEDHPDWGFAMPFKLMKRDMDIIKNLGCNTIRASHYPNAEVFLDYCDEQGILLWEEIPMWGYTEEPLKNPLICKRGLTMLEEMVRRDYHHPCIIMWGMHNEIDTTTQAAYELTKVFTARVRELDSTRLLTFATLNPLEDICYPLVDILSINKYFGWYHGTVEKWVGFLKDVKKRLESQGLINMPIIISEFGAAGIYGDSTFEEPKWTENYQQKYLEYTLMLFLNDPDISGTYIWQYCDIRSSKEMEMGRARSFNNKGIVNEYRKPKLAYWTVQNIYKRH